MMITRRRFLVASVALGLALSVFSFGSGLRAAADLPDKLADADFWRLVEESSEPNGQFQSDNLVSNEIYFQYIIPELQKLIKPGRVYMGVGPEQNFTYIAALKPKMVFIVDIRRGNLNMHMMYKALFELSADRADFVSLLFSRKRPEGLTKASTVHEIFAALAKVATSEELYKQNLKAIQEHLTKKHGFGLTAEDLGVIEYIYGMMYSYGPSLTYSSSTGGGGGRSNFVNYQSLMTTDDGHGMARSYLASEELFGVLKDLETRNMFVPVVGNFGGPKAIRAVGKYLKEKGGVVSAFYLSNVEQYLTRDGLLQTFCNNVASLPLDDASTFIYSAQSGGGGGAGGGLGSWYRPMAAEVKQYNCSAGAPAAPLR